MVQLSLSDFENRVKKAAAFFNSFGIKSPIKIVSHLDTDGICAASILIKALSRLNISYSISILPQLDTSSLYSISQESHNCFIFTDLGSGQLSLIDKFLHTKKVLILDHHEPEKYTPSKNIFHLNPHLDGINGSTEISGSGVVFFFAKELDKKNSRLAHLAVIGAIGDNQENKSKGFSGINSTILDFALKSKAIVVEKGLNFFGQQTKPLHKLLEYSTDYIIPGITGSESNAIQFLNDIGISPKEKNKWKKINDLTENEKTRLVDAIMLKRHSEENPEDIIGNNYILQNEKKGPLRDAREFSTLLNACGRMGKASFGIGSCLGDEKSKKKAIKTLEEYKREIINAISWLKDSMSSNSDEIIYNKSIKMLLINAGFNIPATIIGTITSILSMSSDFGIEENTYIISMARTDNKKTKVSTRFYGKSHESLKKIMDFCITGIDGQAGGHENAAGAIIPFEKEGQFIKNAKTMLTKISKEETVY